VNPFTWLGHWFVLFLQSIVLALGQIWTNKLRSFLTTIGIVIGVASVAAVAAAVAGLEAMVLGQLESFGTNNLFIFPQRTAAQEARRVPWTQIRFKPELFDDLLKDVSTVKSFTRLSDTNDAVRFGQVTISAVQIHGIEPAWHDIQHRYITEGRTFNFIDSERARPVCLVNKTLQQKLGLNKDPTGQAVYMSDRRFIVIGVLEDDPNTGLFGGEGGGAEIFLPFETARRINPNNGLFVIAAAKTTQQSEEALAELTYYMRNKRGIGPGEEDDFAVRSVQRLVEIFGNIAGVITIVATGVVGVSLIVGGVGIMNIMLVSVSERTREIGLRKAVGAKPGAILLQFLIEAVVLCCMGGLIGLGIAQGIVMILHRLPALYLEKAYITNFAIFLSFGFSAGVGLVFGMFPAIKAARLDPIEALRHE
jgi:putative ABC transport system permease protein